MDSPLPFDGGRPHPKARTARPSDELWNVLSEVFGEPRTKTERSMFGRVVKELVEAGATPTEVVRTCAYVTARFDNASVNAVTKWFSASLNETPRLSPQQAEIQKLRAVQ